MRVSRSLSWKQRAHLASRASVSLVNVVLTWEGAGISEGTRQAEVSARFQSFDRGGVEMPVDKSRENQAKDVCPRNPSKQEQT